MGEMGAGPIFGKMMNFLDDMPSWKRQRATMTTAFSTKQLNEMIIGLDQVLVKLVDSIRKLEKQPIELKVLGSKAWVSYFY